MRKEDILGHTLTRVLIELSCLLLLQVDAGYPFKKNLVKKKSVVTLYIPNLFIGSYEFRYKFNTYATTLNQAQCIPGTEPLDSQVKSLHYTNWNGCQYINLTINRSSTFSLSLYIIPSLSLSASLFLLLYTFISVFTNNYKTRECQILSTPAYKKCKRETRKIEGRIACGVHWRDGQASILR